MKRKSGALVIIGGGEDKQNKRVILAEVAARVGAGPLCIATMASSVGEEAWEAYRGIFRKLGVRHISHLSVVHRHEAIDQKALKAVKGARGIFFTGGDQLKITAELGGTEIADRIHELYAHGGVIAGTSAGAAVMSETMLVAGKGVASHRIGSGLRMSPGLGFVKNMIIDQHFAERGRIGRLLAAVAQNPKFLGVGIDEDTAVVLDSPEKMHVIGSGAVYVIDAHESTDSNISDATEEQTLSLFNVCLHHLSHGDAFDLKLRTPKRIALSA